MLLSVASPALILTTNSGVSAAKIGECWLKVSSNWLKIGENVRFSFDDDGAENLHKRVSLELHRKLGSDFGRTDFSRIFIFGPPDFFVDFLAGFFLLIFVGKVPRKILQENPRENPPKFIQQNPPTPFCRLAGATET